MDVSLPEIMGWKRRTESWPEVNYGGPADKPYKQVTRDYWEAPDGEERGPTIDDMLAWLRERCPRWVLWGDGTSFRFYSDNKPLAEGSVLRDTLEAAVREAHGHE